MRRSRTEQGFSLIELMVVVTIVAIVSALVLPGMSQASRDRRIQQAAISALDVIREVRSRAMYRGAAQLLVIQNTGNALRFDAYEGSSSSCRMSRFSPTAGVLDPQARVATLDLSETRYVRDGLWARISVPAAAAQLQVCFTPTGNAYFSNDSTVITSPTEGWSNDSTLVGVGGAYQIDVFQIQDGVELGVRRHVLIPLGGNPRMRI